MNQKEPVVLGGLVILAYNAILTALLEFNVWSPTAGQQRALYGLVNAALVIIVAFKTRSVVYSPYTVSQATKPSPETIGPGGIGPKAVTPESGESTVVVIAAIAFIVLVVLIITGDVSL